MCSSVQLVSNVSIRVRESVYAHTSERPLLMDYVCVPESVAVNILLTE